MNSNDINKLAQEHKKFMEKVDSFPYRLIMDNLKSMRGPTFTGLLQVYTEVFYLLRMMCLTKKLNRFFIVLF